MLAMTRQRRSRPQPLSETAMQAMPGASPRLFRAAILIALFTIVPLHARTVRATARSFARRAVAYQLDGYKALAYVDVLEQYGVGLLDEFRAKHGRGRRLRRLLRAVAALDAARMRGRGPFAALEQTVRDYDTTLAPGTAGRSWRRLRRDRHAGIDITALPSCDFDTATVARTQICVHFMPDSAEHDPAKRDLVFITTGGRRTGMTKLVGLGKDVHRLLRERFNLYALTVEAEMFSRDEPFVKWRIAHALKALVDFVRVSQDGAPPLIVLAGYSYGGAHLIDAVNHILTRPSFEAYRPDLLVLIDPCRSLNTLDRLHLVPAAKRVVNYRGVFITPQPTLVFLARLITGRVDRYPSIEGTQPLVLLRKADFEEVIVYQPNGLDVSGHNRVPFDMVEPCETTGATPYLHHIEEELDRLTHLPANGGE